MRILYVSVHQILEFDEINLLQSLGHTVFPLGTFFPERVERFRPMPTLKPESGELRRIFHETGCKYSYGMPPEDIILSRRFLDEFDACIVMHDLQFIRSVLYEKADLPVVWRSIGVSIDYYEDLVGWFSKAGGAIVRYSPMEAACSIYAGHDAVIRFGKDSSSFYPWTGEEKQVLLFSNDIRSRFPCELAFVEELVEGRRFMLSGRGNEGERGALGLVSYERQLELLAESRVYLYSAGTFIPYTLNYIEACMSGLPVIVVDPRLFYSADECKYAETPLLAGEKGCGLFVDSFAGAQVLLDELLNDRERAAEAGANSREAALKLFSYEAVAPQWSSFLRELPNFGGLR